jgi:hypothetical protein
VIQSARRHHHQLVAAEAALELALERVAAQAGHGLERAEDGPAERVVAPQLLGKQVGHLLVGVVLVGEDLLAHHALLALDLGGVEARAAHEVGDHVHRLRQVLAQHRAV